MSRYTDLIRSMGGNPYTYDRTKAQIEQQTKANPLGGYGFMSAKDKQRRQMEMALYERELKQQQDMQQQQLLSRMSSQSQIGSSVGQGLTGMFDAFSKRKKAPQEEPRDDVEIERFKELSQQVGPETALEMLGAELQNPQMIQDAQKQRADRKKAELEMQNLQGQVDDRKKKPNEVRTFSTMFDGKPAEVDMEIVGKDANGNNIYKEITKGLKGTVADTNEGWGNTKGGIDKRAANMENALTSTANALDAYDKMTTLVDENPNALGWSGRLIAKADQAVSGVKNLGQTLAAAEGRKFEASEDIGSYNWGKLEKVAMQSEKMKSLILQLAYAQAAATGDSSRSLSDRDVQNQIDIIGGQITNPNSFKALMEQNKDVLVHKLENMGRYVKINGKPINEGYEQDIQGLVDRVRPPKATDESSSDEDKRKRLEFLRKKLKK